MIIKPLNHWKGVWEVGDQMKTESVFPPHSPEWVLEAGVGMKTGFDFPPYPTVERSVRATEDLKTVNIVPSTPYKGDMK